MGTPATQARKKAYRHCLLGAGLALIASCVTGCGRNGPPMAPVKGRILLDGKPIEGAAVGFMPVGGGPVASATSDADGCFTLSTMNRPGAPIGEHVVTVTKVRQLGLNPDGSIAPGGVKTKWLVPRKYSKPTTSDLKAVVEEDGLERDFELSSR
jgi:hypothetical protein